MSLPTPKLAERRSLFTTLLRPFGTVEPGEVATAALMTLTVFLLLTAYYILKTAREPLILLQGGAAVKAYASAGQAMLLVPVIGAYSALAKRVGRIKLLVSVYLFFLSNLILFAMAVTAGLKIGIVFYLWVGIFDVTVIAQFWSFANDIYTPEQGKRLFAILGIGSSVGAVAGAAVAHSIGHWGPNVLMLAASALLVACVVLFIVVDRREGARSAGGKRASDEPIEADKIFRKLARDHYLLLIAALTLVLNWVNNNGEYLVDRTCSSSSPSHAS
jgi:AAA family ATP:ADP antiporter